MWSVSRVVGDIGAERFIGIVTSTTAIGMRREKTDEERLVD